VSRIDELLGFFYAARPRQRHWPAAKNICYIIVAGSGTAAFSIAPALLLDGC